MFEIVDFSINKPNGKHADLMKRVRPIIQMMYTGVEGAEEKVEKIIVNAGHFREMITDRVYHSDIKQYLNSTARHGLTPKP